MVYLKAAAVKPIVLYNLYPQILNKLPLTMLTKPWTCATEKYFLEVTVTVGTKSGLRSSKRVLFIGEAGNLDSSYRGE